MAQAAVGRPRIRQVEEQDPVSSWTRDYAAKEFPDVEGSTKARAENRRMRHAQHTHGANRIH